MVRNASSSSISVAKLKADNTITENNAAVYIFDSIPIILRDSKIKKYDIIIGILNKEKRY